MSDDAYFVLAVVRAHRWRAGCIGASASSSSTTDAQRDSIEFFLPRVDDADALVPPTSPTASCASSHAAPLVTPDELLACAQMLVAATDSATTGGGSSAGISTTTSDMFNDNASDDDGDEEEEVFSREMDTTGFRHLHLGHNDSSNDTINISGSTASSTTAKRLLGAAGDDTGIFFHVPHTLERAKTLRAMGIAVPDPRSRKTLSYVQHDVRFLVLLSTSPFRAHLRAQLQDVAALFFREDSAIESLEPLTALYQELAASSASTLSDLPYRELFVGLPILPLVRRLGTDIIAVLRVVLLEGRVVCYSSNASLASAATLALLALLPGVLASTSCATAPRTIHAALYRLRRVGLPFALFHDTNILQPCFTTDQATNMYSARGFVVGTSDPLLLKHPNAQLDVIVDLDVRQVVTFPTRTTESAFAVGAATTTFAAAIAARVGCSGASDKDSATRTRSQSLRQSMRNATNRAVSQLMLTSVSIPVSLPAFIPASVQPTTAAAASQMPLSDTDWVLAQCQQYFERFVDDAFTAVTTTASSSNDINSQTKDAAVMLPPKQPRQTSLRSLLGDLTSSVTGNSSSINSSKDHAQQFFTEYNRTWVHAWQSTSNYDAWLSAHRRERQRRRSSITQPHNAVPLPPPQDGDAVYCYANGDEYDGAFAHSKRHGFGVYVECVTKYRYEGDWVDDKRHGQGILSSKQHGYIYDGDWRDDVRSGRGSSSLRNVESYAGEWLDNSFHGAGVYTNADGDVYDGEWRHGKRDGVGKLTVARPSRSDEFGGLVHYSGEWRRGLVHGTGTATYADGTEFTGRFDDGKRHGTGMLASANGDRYDGQWWKGYRHGEGSLFVAASGATREGTWHKDREVDGVWFIVFANGDKYAGACRRGRPWGDGTCKYANQSSYDGAWVDGLRDGYGVCVSADGTILEGEWKNSVFVRPMRPPSRFVDVALTTPTGAPSAVASVARTNSARLSSLTNAAERLRQPSVSAASLPSPPESGSHSFVYPNGDTYDGAFQHGLRHGFGVFTESATGNVYEGAWVANMRHGSGVLTSGAKDFIYDGAWDQDVRSGYGHCVIRGCETYSGEWQRNQFHGVGKFIDAEGHVYDGEFAAGQKHGVGKQVFATQPSKEQYAGEWAFGFREGVGDAMFADGSTYSGSWRRDVRDGEGTFVAPNGGDVYAGQWRNGMRDGAGVLTLASTRVVKEGAWSQDEPLDGEWTIGFPDGSKFTGACVSGRPHGHGVCKYANGDLYDGAWVHGKRHGLGTGFFANGESFVGEWENNHVALNGRGKLTLADGTVHVYAK